MAIAIFVPVHNDEKTLGPILSKVPKKINSHETALFVVDDGSSDCSAQVARLFTPNVIQHKINMGVGAATRTGLIAINKFSHFDFVIKLDADGQHDPFLIPSVVSSLENEADIVICSRFHAYSDIKNAFIDRMLLNTSAASWVNQVTGWSISDARSGFMGFKSSHIKSIASDIITDRYGIPIELLLRIYNLNPSISVCEIPHPAMYGGDISVKLNRKYSKEEIADKVDRMRVAYSAFLNVLHSLGFNLNEHRKASIA